MQYNLFVCVCHFKKPLRFRGSCQNMKMWMEARVEESRVEKRTVNSKDPSYRVGNLSASSEFPCLHTLDLETTFIGRDLYFSLL
jgi:hypothetical protein